MSIRRLYNFTSEKTCLYLWLARVDSFYSITSLLIWTHKSFRVLFERKRSMRIKNVNCFLQKDLSGRKTSMIVMVKRRIHGTWSILVGKCLFMLNIKDSRSNFLDITLMSLMVALNRYMSIEIVMQTFLNHFPMKNLFDEKFAVFQRLYWFLFSNWHC